MICRKGKLPKLEKQLLRTKVISSFKEALSKVIFTSVLLPVHAEQNFVTARNYFSSPLKGKLVNSLITFFSLLCGIFV